MRCLRRSARSLTSRNNYIGHLFAFEEHHSKVIHFNLQLWSSYKLWSRLSIWLSINFIAKIFMHFCSCVSLLSCCSCILQCSSGEILPITLSVLLWQISKALMRFDFKSHQILLIWKANVIHSFCNVSFISIMIFLQTWQLRMLHGNKVWSFVD